MKISCAFLSTAARGCATRGEKITAQVTIYGCDPSAILDFLDGIL